MQLGVFAKVAALARGLGRLDPSVRSFDRFAELVRWLEEDADRVAVVAVDSPTELVVDLRAGRSHLVVLLPTDDEDAQLAAMRSGASGVATWNVDGPALWSLIEAAAADRTVIPSTMARRLTGGDAVELTPWEAGALRRLGSGEAIAESAKALQVDEGELYRRLATLYRKMGARSRLEAVLIAERLGLIDR